MALETGTALQRSQDLMCALIEGVKGTYLSQINRASIEALIQELDLLMAAARERQEGSGGGPATD